MKNKPIEKEILLKTNNNTEKIKVEKSKKGISILLVLLSNLIFTKKSVVAKTKHIFAMLDPITFPKTISNFLSKTA